MNVKEKVHSELMECSYTSPGKLAHNLKLISAEGFSCDMKSPTPRQLVTKIPLMYLSRNLEFKGLELL